MLNELEDIIDDIRSLFLKVELYDGYEQIPEEEIDELPIQDLISDLVYALTGVGEGLVGPLVKNQCPDLLFTLSKPGVDRLSQDKLEFAYQVKNDTLLGKVQDTRSGIFLAYPITEEIEGLSTLLSPYRLAVGVFH